MAGRFRAGGREYIDTPAGHLAAAADRVADKARLRGHQMMHWRKETRAVPPYFTARCGNCGGALRVRTGRAPWNDPDYPGAERIIMLGRVRWCPGPP
jgi:hypothetical protein